MKATTLFSIAAYALTVAARPPIVNITEVVVSPENERLQPLAAAADPGFCYYDIWEYSTWDCTGDQYTEKRTIQSTDCFNSIKNPNHCIWIRPLGDDRCFHGNTVWFYKANGSGCNEHHKFEGKFEGETIMNIHHPWDSLILNK